MGAALKKFRPANDVRPNPQPPRFVRIITASPKRQLQVKWVGLIIAGIIMPCILMLGGMAGAILWLTYDARTVTQVVLALPEMPVQEAQPQELVKILPEVSAQEPVAAEPVIATPMPPVAEAPVEPPADIVLSEDTLAPPPAAMEITPPLEDPRLDAVVDKIGTTPVTPPSRGLRIQMTPDHTLGKDALLESAQARLAAGDYNAALALYGHVLERDPQNQRALAGRAFLLARAGRYDEAVETGRQLLKLNPKDSAARSNLAAALGQSSLPDATDELQKMIKAYPREAAPLAGLAQILARQGKGEEAITYLDRAARAAPENASYRLDLAILYDRGGHKAEALSLYRQVLDAWSHPHVAPAGISLPSIRLRAEYLGVAGEKIKE